VQVPLSRRQLLLAGAGSLLVAACGKDEGEDAADASSTTAPGATGGGLMLVPAFKPVLPVGQELRLPLSLADGEGAFDVDLPRTVRIRLRRPDGTTTDAVTVDRHQQDLPRGYFPLRTSFDTAGRWAIELETGTTQVEATVDVRPKEELPAIPGPGDFLPKVATPTRVDRAGVNPICTAEPPCPFHEVSLDQAIGAGNPIVLLVSTPAFCQVAICGPVNDLLTSRRERLRDERITAIHAEVYVDRRARQTAPVIDALGLDFEPSLFLAAPDGTVTERLDAIFDGAELDEALSRLAP
jgi:hypothetical protein